MEAQGLRRQLRWLIGIRLVIITSVVLPYFMLQLLSGDLETGAEFEALATEAGPLLTGHFLYLLAGLTYLGSLIYILLLRVLDGRHELQASIQFFGDLLLITGLIYYFGGISNPFSLLYLIVIAVASMMLRRRAGFAVASVAYVLYAFMLIALFFGWLPRVAGGLIPSSQGSIFLLVYNLAVHLFGFYAVAAMTYFLAHRATHAERELEAQREDLAALQLVHRDVIQSITSGLITTDLDGSIRSVNRAGLDILEVRAEDLLDRKIYGGDLLSEDQWREITSGTMARPNQMRSEVRVVRGGTPKHIGFSLASLTDAEGKERGRILIFQDLTRWRQLQEEMRLKDRMAAVGELAAGIAHEIGNPLAAISGSVQMLSSKIQADGSERQLLDILRRESQRLDRTIKGFLRFARPKDRSVIHFDIASLLAENFQLLKNSEEVSKGHHLELRLVPPSARLVGDPDQITQIFWNLARNALRAMPGGGSLEVRGKALPERYTFEVVDTGCGMTEDERANLFHPFQSFFDGGSGIGMAIVYRIVEEHHGRLGVESEPGRGTKITVELPSRPPSSSKTPIQVPVGE